MDTIQSSFSILNKATDKPYGITRYRLNFSIDTNLNTIVDDPNKILKGMEAVLLKQLQYIQSQLEPDHNIK